MNTVGLILIAISFAALVFNSILNELRLRKSLKLNRELLSKLAEQHDNNSEIMAFSLKCIIKEAIEKEDYETAIKCKNLLDKYQDQDHG